MKNNKFYPTVNIGYENLNVTVALNEDLSRVDKDDQFYLYGWIENEKGEIIVENPEWAFYTTKKEFKQELGGQYKKVYWKEVKVLAKRLMELGILQDIH